MGKVYLFNPQPSESSANALGAYVNTAPVAYKIPFARNTFDYIPSSTSGNRSNSRSGNDFAFDNTFLVDGVPPKRLYQLDLPEPPPVTADLILYIFQTSLLLFGTDGRYLKSYSPSPLEITLKTESESAGRRAAEANGTVYVFNLFNEKMDPFSPNGASAGSVEAWSKGDVNDPPIYTPNVLMVGRVLNASQGPGHISNGTNSIFLVWSSNAGTITLKIDGAEFPITQNLFLFVLRDRWFLSDTYGVQRLDGRID